MVATCSLPDAAKTQDLLGILFDGLEAKAGGKFDESPAAGAWFGVFIDDHGEPLGLCGADVNLAASLGAALSMLPVMAVTEAVKARELTGVMIENVRETMNICTRLMMGEGSPHLKLEQVYPRKALPAAAAALLAPPHAHREFQLRLPKYGGGVLSVWSR